MCAPQPTNGDILIFLSSPPPSPTPTGGLWQSELGWNTFEGLLPSVYTRFFHWAITRGAALAPAAGGDAYRLLWYAWWQPGDNRTLVNNAPAGAAGTVPTFHGRQLMHLAALFGDNGTCAVTALDGAFATRPPLPSTALGDSDPAAVGFRVHGRAASGSDRAVVALFLAPNATATVAVQSPTLTTAAQRAATATGASVVAVCCCCWGQGLKVGGSIGTTVCRRVLRRRSGRRASAALR